MNAAVVWILMVFGPGFSGVKGEIMGRFTSLDLCTYVGTRIQPIDFMNGTEPYVHTQCLRSPPEAAKPAKKEKK